MKLTTKGRFAVTAVLDLALHQAKGPVTLAEISQRQQISLSYLEQLFSKLRRKKIVNSVRGPGGGYQLAQKAEEITVADIIFAVDEPVDATNCSGKGNCNGHGKKCLTHELWNSLTNVIVDHMRGVTLASLMDEQDMAAIANKQESEQKIQTHSLRNKKEKPEFKLPNSVFAWASR